VLDRGLPLAEKAGKRGLAAEAGDDALRWVHVFG
jgi:hypothetical protein